MKDMNIEQKDLLLKDLCPRLPYGVKGVNMAGIVTDPSDWYCGFVRLSKELENRICFSDWKPYLFPLSSMTEEQSKELEEIDPEFYSLIRENGDICISMDVRGYDWLNKNHFDYRGLIDKGLAIDATGKNIY